MTRFLAACVPAVVAVSLAACSPQPNTVPTPQVSAGPPPTATQQPAVSAGGGGGLNGTYRGSAYGNSACGTTRFGYPIHVANGVATMQTNTQGQLEGPVGPDGSLNIQHGNTNLVGKFGDGQFNGTLNFGRCGYSLAYKK